MRTVNLSWLLACVLLVGCCTLECVGPVDRNIKPYIEYWVKEGVTNEGRLRNWVACGGDKDDSFSWKEIERISGESNEQSSKRQDDNHQRCMIRAGYHYTGNCSSEYMKSQPLCGAL